MKKNEIVYRIVSDDPFGLLAKQIKRRMELDGYQLDLSPFEIARVCLEDDRIIKKNSQRTSGRTRWITKE